MSARVLVTGGAGFVGAHVVRALLAAGHASRLRVLHLPGEDLRNLAGLDVERFPGDLRDPARVREAVRGCDRVFHVAALYALWLPDPRAFHAVNVEGTRHVLDACVALGVERVVYTSSIAAFGGQGLDRDATEETPSGLLATGDAYARSKSEAHGVALGFARRGLDLRVVAPCGPLGPGDVGPTPTGRLLLSTVNYPVVMVTPTISNMVDVRDVAAGHLLAAERGRAGESYLLGGENWSIADLARAAMAIAGVWRPLLWMPNEQLELAGRAAVAYADRVSRRAPLVTPAAARIARLGLRASSAKAIRELGYTPRPVEGAIRDALAWFAKEGYVTSRAARARLA